MSAVRGEVVDRDAIEIGELYSKARMSIVESVRYQFECGVRLAKKKAELGHGNWLPWLKENEGVLGFSSDRTAQRLIGLSKQSEENPTLTSDLEPEQAIQISRQVWGNAPAHGTQGSGLDEWFTPADVIADVQAVLGEIELDPASNAVAQQTVQAGRFFTIEDDALTKEWKARTVFMNPPYSTGKIQEFVDKLCAELVAGNVNEAIMLTNSLTDTAWFHKAEEMAAAICFTRGRIRFIHDGKEGKSPTWGQAFFYFGENDCRFREVFIKRGFVR